MSSTMRALAYVACLILIGVPAATAKKRTETEPTVPPSTVLPEAPPASAPVPSLYDPTPAPVDELPPTELPPAMTEEVPTPSAPVDEPAAVVVPAPSVPATPVVSAHVLDGHTFMGEWGKQGEASNGPQEVMFANGKLQAKQPAGFKSGAYTADGSGDTVTFKANLSGPKGERLEWRGTVKKGQLSAVFTWFREPKNPVDYWVKGQSSR